MSTPPTTPPTALPTLIQPPSAGRAPVTGSGGPTGRRRGSTTTCISLVTSLLTLGLLSVAAWMWVDTLRFEAEAERTGGDASLSGLGYLIAIIFCVMPAVAAWLFTIPAFVLRHRTPVTAIVLSCAGLTIALGPYLFLCVSWLPLLGSA